MLYDYKISLLYPIDTNFRKNISPDSKKVTKITKSSKEDETNSPYEKAGIYINKRV